MSSSVSAPVPVVAASPTVPAATPTSTPDASSSSAPPPSKGKYADTAVPYSALTPDLLDKYKDRIKVRPIKKRNKFGGYSADMYIDDGTGRDRPVVLEFTDLVSKFGISYQLKSELAKKNSKKKGGDDAADGESKVKAGDQEDESWSISFPMRKNSAEFAKAIELIDTIARREVFLNRATLLESGAELEARDVNRSCKSAARKPDNKDSAEQYGSNFKVAINPYEKSPAPGFYIADPSQPEDRQVPVSKLKEELKDKAGLYTFRAVWSKINLLRGEQTSGFKWMRGIYSPDVDEDDGFSTRQLRVAGQTAAAPAPATAATPAPATAAAPAPVATADVPAVTTFTSPTKADVPVVPAAGEVAPVVPQPSLAEIENVAAATEDSPTSSPSSSSSAAGKKPKRKAATDADTEIRRPRAKVSS